MNKETLAKAKSLERKIKHLDRALNCFEFSPDPPVGEFDPQNPGKPITRNPRILIEYDPDGYDPEYALARDVAELPFELSEEFIEVIKQNIKDQLKTATDEFDQL
jgi:hypothetical protein